jgi:deazaflavin-dependent oxidoreductase (nitroreductase family)
MDKALDLRLRQGFKYMNHFMLLLWQLGLGGWLNAWPPVVGRIMVLTHTGRKTGLRRRTPVNYAVVGRDIYCTVGFGSVSDWYRNIKRDPTVEVWLPEGWWRGQAEEVAASENSLYLMRQVLIASGFAARVAGINPQTMSDAELEQATADYHLIRIRRQAAKTGAGGPGELAWIWPLATLVLLALVARPGRRKGIRR